jgi:hypothetical protein
LAQAAAPAAVSEYVAQQPSAGGVAGTGGSGGSNNGQAVEGASGNEGASGTVAQTGSGGSLPFTGYPMTSIVWIALALLLSGVAVRLGLAGFRRYSAAAQAS